MDQWEMTADGTPYFKAVPTDYVDPRPSWGPYWPYRATLIRNTKVKADSGQLWSSVPSSWTRDIFWHDRSIFDHGWF